MRYLIMVLLLCWFLVLGIAGCAHYRSKSRAIESTAEYSYEDFKESDIVEPDEDDLTKIYHIKIVHISL